MSYSKKTSTFIAKFRTSETSKLTIRSAPRIGRRGVTDAPDADKHENFLKTNRVHLRTANQNLTTQIKNASQHHHPFAPMTSHRGAFQTRAKTSERVRNRHSMSSSHRVRTTTIAATQLTLENLGRVAPSHRRRRRTWRRSRPIAGRSASRPNQ